MKFYSIQVIRLFTLILFSEVFFLASCGGGGGDSSQGSNSQPLTIVIDFPDETPTPAESRISEITRSLDDLDTCKIIVSGGIPPIKEIVKEFDIDETKSISVPVGNNRMFTFIGQDMQGQPICRGETIADVNPQSTVVIIGCEFVDEICTDGIDNDSDNLIDCEDPDCDRISCNIDNIDFQCIDGACVTPTPEPSPTNSPGSSPSPFPTVNPGSGGATPTPAPTIMPSPTPIASPSPTPTSTGDCTGSGGGNCGVGGGGGGGNGTDNEGNNN